MLADETLNDLDVTLSDNNVAPCALQEIRRDGVMSTLTDNYKVYWFGEGSGQRGVGYFTSVMFILSKPYTLFPDQMVG